MEWVLKRIIHCLDGESKKKRKKYASQFVDRVKRVLVAHEKEGCVESDFVPFFKLGEMDLVHYTLAALYARNVIGREMRYFHRPIKDN